MARLINTRRIGATADGGSVAAPVDAAVKYVGERGRWDLTTLPRPYCWDLLPRHRLPP
jgi:hypothetical protein